MEHTNKTVWGIHKFFYLNDEAHQRIHINKGKDVLTAWNFPRHCRMSYSYTDAKKKIRPCFSTEQVAKMIKRKRVTILMGLSEGNFRKPQKAYPWKLGMQEPVKTSVLLWAEDDVLALHDFFITQHRGKARKDGNITPQALPTRLELKAMMDQKTVLYVMTDKGEFVPTWEAHNF